VIDVGNDRAVPGELANRVRDACLRAATEAYEDAGLRGLCAEGRWECALDAIRSLPLEPLADIERHGSADS
jgi:hypothetical protein